MRNNMLGYSLRILGYSMQIALLSMRKLRPELFDYGHLVC